MPFLCFFYEFKVKVERDQPQNSSIVAIFIQISRASPKVPTLPPAPCERCSGFLRPSVAPSGAALETEGAQAPEGGRAKN